MVQIPIILADNAGYDSAGLVAELKSEHAQGHTTAGLGKLYLYSCYITYQCITCFCKTYCSVVVSAALYYNKLRVTTLAY